jgi:hypothetical protein
VRQVRSILRLFRQPYPLLKRAGGEREVVPAELQNMRVLLEDTRLLTRNLAYHRRAKLEARLELVLYELERQIKELRADRS